MKEPLQQLRNKYGIELSTIARVVAGSKYCAVQLDDRHIGVCATLGNPVPTASQKLAPLDLGLAGHRIIANAYFNARLNHRAQVLKQRDITEIVDFSRYNSLVMIGLFKPVVEKLAARGLEPAVFDPRHAPGENRFLLPEKRKEEFLGRADAVILSATTIGNLTFTRLLAAVAKKAEIFVLGPSTPLAPELFAYPGIRALFGTVFSPGDERVLEAVAAGRGTRSFIRYADKVVMSRKSGGG